MMFYHGSDKKRHKDQVMKVAFTLQVLEDRTNFLHGTTVFGTAVYCYRTCVILVNKWRRVMLSYLFSCGLCPNGNRLDLC